MQHWDMPIDIHPSSIEKQRNPPLFRNGGTPLRANHMQSGHSPPEQPSLAKRVVHDAAVR